MGSGLTRCHMPGCDPATSPRPSIKYQSCVESMVFGAEESQGTLKLNMSHSQTSILACLPADILQYMLTFLWSDIVRLDCSWTCRFEREMFWLPVLRNSFGSKVTTKNRKWCSSKRSSFRSLWSSSVKSLPTLKFCADHPRTSSRQSVTSVGCNTLLWPTRL